MNIDELIQDVIKTINPTWSNKYKIRRVYTTLGEKLSKNTDFFFSLERKLEEKNLSLEDIKKINDGEILDAYKVTCHSSAKLLKMIYDKLDIKSTILAVDQNAIYNIDNEDLNIKHYVLLVEDGQEENTIYYESLVPDLALIQQGLMPKHFLKFDKRLFNTHSLKENSLNISAEDINKFRKEYEKIDIETGYIKTYYDIFNKNNYELKYNDYAFEILHKAMISNKLYEQILVSEEYAYKKMTNFIGSNNQNINLTEIKLTDLGEEDWQMFINNICNFVKQKISTIFPNCSIENLNIEKLGYETWLKEICLAITSSVIQTPNISLTDLKNNFNFSTWCRQMKATFNDNNEAVIILARLNSIIPLCNKKRIIKEKNLGKKLYHFLSFLSLKFVNPKYYPQNIKGLNYIPNDYIGYKFFKLFPYIFNCTGLLNQFNKSEYYEQVIIIKQVLELLFPELTYANCHLINAYQENFSPVSNRIHILPIMHKKTGEYSIIFNIVASKENNEEDYYFKYDIKNNNFEVVNILNIKLNYIIISSRLKSKIEQVEDNNQITI